MCDSVADECVSVRAKICGGLDRDRLVKAVHDVIAQHEILRTNFRKPAGIQVPLQVIADSKAPEWHDVDQRSEGRPAASVGELLAQPFDLESGSTLKCVLISLPNEEFEFVLGMSCMTADSRSLSILLAEIAKSYAGEDRTEPVQYVDFAEWQHELIDEPDEKSKRGAEFWSRVVEGQLCTPSLPLESSAAPAGRLHSLRVDLSTQVSELEPFAASLDTSLQNVLLASWVTLLWRLSGRQDFVTHTLGSGRNSDELFNAIGPYDRVVPISCRFHEGETFADVVWQVSRSQRDAMQWIDYLPWAQAEKPIISFAFRERPTHVLSEGLTLSELVLRDPAPELKLRLTIVRSKQTVEAVFDFDSEVYKQQDVARLADHFQVIVTSAVEKPERPISELKLLTESQRHHLLVELNKTQRAYPREQCIHELFEQQVAKTPDWTALVFEEERYTYAELNAKANQLANLLRRRPSASGENRIGLCVDRSAAMIIGLIGILKSGAAYVPIAPDTPIRRLETICREACLDTVVTVEAYRDSLPDVQAICLDDASSLASQSQENSSVSIPPTDVGYVIYTSGSTGTPKGVEVSHRNLVNYACDMCNRLGLEDLNTPLTFATVSTITADLGNTTIFTSLFSGGCLHVLSQAVATDGRQFYDHVSREPIDVLKIVPSHFRALLSAQPAGRNIAPRRFLLLGGESLSYELVSEITAVSSECEIINHYGPTEATVGCLVSTIRSPTDSGPADRPKSGSAPIGCPISNTDVYVLDEDLSPVPIGVAGELFVGGAGVARGYLGKPELTAERFLSHPFSDDTEARVYRTGDRARYLRDGQIEFLGRNDHQIKLRGFRVELGEIESVLRQHEKVSETVVLAREDEPGQVRLVAYVVPQANTSAPDEELLEFASTMLPTHMIPTAIVSLDFLPLTPNGKIDRQSLPAPEQNRRSQYVAPATETETMLAEIWEAVLGVESIGVNDNFFTDLGGDSILSIQIIARANAAGLQLVPKQLFECQTIAELAAVAGTVEIHQAEQGVVTGEFRPTPIQQWFFDHDFEQPAHWNQSVFLRVSAEVPVEKLQGIVQQLMEHHDALRTHFLQNSHTWVPCIRDVHPIGECFSQIDLSGVDDEGRKEVVERVAAEAQSSLQLHEGPVIRWIHMRLPKDEARLLIVCHHLVVDGVSWRLLLEDLQLGMTSQREIVLPAKTMSFKAWSEKLVEYANTDEVITEADTWSSAIPTEVRAIPVDYPERENRSGDSESITLTLDESETLKLIEELPEKAHAGINDVLLTGLVLGFSSWSGARSLLVDLEGHGREELPQTSLWRSVGWFTTHYPVHLDLGTAVGLDDSIKAIKEQARAIPRSGLGFGLLKYLCNDEAATAIRSLPEPQVSFNYLGQLDQVLPESSPIAPASESVGPQQGAQNRRTHELSFVSSVKAGQLHLTCLFSQQRYDRETVDRLMTHVIQHIRELVSHCATGSTSTFTPSDFELADIDVDALDQVSGLLDELDD